MSSKDTVAPQAPQQPAVPQTPALEEFLEANFRKIVIAFVAVIAVAVAYGVISYQGRRAAEAAATEATGAKTKDDYDLVVKNHPGTVAAGNALLAKAKILWDDNKKDTAVATLREFVSKYTDHPFFAQGSLSLATRLESLGGKDVAEAKTIFEKLAKDEGKSDIGSLAQLRLGDLLWNEGKTDEAKKVYEALPQKMTGSPFFEHNTERMKWLAAGLPTKEVEGPKPPPDSLKAPAMNMNLNSGAQKSPLGSLMSNLKAAVPDAKLDVKPVAVPAPPKPGVVTPGAALPVPTPPVKVAPPTATSAPVQVPAPPAKPAPTPEPANPAKPSSTTNPPPAPVPVVPPAPAPEAK